jgi:hypothetical protein
LCHVSVKPLLAPFPPCGNELHMEQMYAHGILTVFALLEVIRKCQRFYFLKDLWSENIPVLHNIYIYDFLTSKIKPSQKAVGV